LFKLRRIKVYKIISTLSAITLSLLFAGCSTNQDMGTATGALLGGALGSTVGKGHGKTAAIIGGAVIGSVIGGNVGRSMDKNDQMQMTQALEVTPTNKPYAWQNPDTGNHYTVVATQTVIAPSGQPCREYTTEAIIGGERQKIYGKACRDASGQWKIVN
jgi:surface antigen